MMSYFYRFNIKSSDKQILFQEKCKTIYTLTHRRQIYYLVITYANVTQITPH